MSNIDYKSWYEQKKLDKEWMAKRNETSKKYHAKTRRVKSARELELSEEIRKLQRTLWAERKKSDPVYQARKKKRMKAYFQKRYAALREKMIARAKKKYRENREEIREYMKEYYETNRERILEQLRAKREREIVG